MKAKKCMNAKKSKKKSKRIKQILNVLKDSTIIPLPRYILAALFISHCVILMIP